MMKFSGKKPIFIELADYFISLINKGAYQEGEYLPSVREVANLENVNPNTVNKSYLYLAELGYVTGVPKKGYYINKIKENKVETLHDSLNELLKKYSIEEVENILKIMKEGDKK